MKHDGIWREFFDMNHIEPFPSYMVLLWVPDKVLNLKDSFPYYSPDEGTTSLKLGSNGIKAD